MLDPGNYTPHYNANLCHGLAARGHDIVLETSEYLFEQVPAARRLPSRKRVFSPRAAGEGAPAPKPPRQAVKAAWSSRTGRALPDVVHVQWSLVPLLDVRLYRRLQRRGVGC